VGTAKRERQKANRQLRLQELAKQARRDKTRKLTIRVISVVLAAVAVVGVVYLVGHKSGSTASTADTTPATEPCSANTSTAATTTTTTPASTTTVVTPKVSLPAALPTSLKVTTLKDGTGTGAKQCDTIVANYVGVRTADGTEFDNSYKRGQPISFVLGIGGVIPGWDQGLLGAKVGSRLQLDIPAALAYGNTAPQGSTIIKPGDSLSFVVDIVAIEPGKQNPNYVTTTTAAGTVPGTTPVTTPGSAGPTTTSGGSTATTAGATTSTSAATSTSKG
jgi:peptidylprolyl isomerase